MQRAFIRPVFETGSQVQVERHPEDRLTASWARVLLVVVPLFWAAGFALNLNTALLGLTVLSVLLVLAGLKWAGLGMLGMGIIVSIEPLARNYLNGAGYIPFHFFNFLLLALMAYYLPFQLRLNDIHTRLFQIFMLLLAFEIAISVNKTSGVSHVLEAVTMLGFLPFLARTARRPAVLYWTALVASVTGAVGMLVYYNLIGSVSYLNPNYVAKFPAAAILISMLAFRAADNFRFGRTALMLFSLFNAFMVFLTGSRGNMLIAAVALLFMLLWERRLSWKLMVVGLGAAAAITAFTLFPEQQAYALERVQILFSGDVSLNRATSGRVDITQRGIALFLNNPLGIGTGGFVSTISQVSQYVDSSVAAHSGWIKVLAENGVPGILLMVTWVASFALSGLRRSDRDSALLGVAVSAVLAVAFISSEFQSKMLWFLAAGAAVALQAPAFRAAARKTMSVLQSRRIQPVRVGEPAEEEEDA